MTVCFNQNVACLMKVISTFVIGLIFFMCAGPVSADEIVLDSMRLTDIHIQTIADGTIVYTIGRREYRHEIKASVLALDEAPSLDEAERVYKEGQVDQAIELWDQALTEAEHSWQRAWIHYRKALAYDTDNQYTLAATSWAELVLESSDPFWVVARPLCEPDRPTVEQVDEALKRLRLAETSIVEPTLKSTIRELIEEIRILRTTAGDTPADPVSEEIEIDPSRQVDDEALNGTNEKLEVVPESPVEQPDDEDRSPIVDEPARLLRLIIESRSTPPNRIDEMLLKDRIVEAEQALVSLIADPGDYPLDHLLFQYAMVLKAIGHPHEAMLRFLQCAILYENSEYAAARLIETAMLYDETYQQRETAVRLIERAIGVAMRNDQGAIMEEAQGRLRGF